MATLSELREERRRIRALDLGLRTDDLDDAIREATAEERRLRMAETQSPADPASPAVAHSASPSAAASQPASPRCAASRRGRATGAPPLGGRR